MGRPSSLSALQAAANVTTPASLLGKQKEKNTYIYCRVSSKKQQGDLERQVAYLAAKYPEASILTDIASGINFNRTGNYEDQNLNTSSVSDHSSKIGLRALVRLVLRGNVQKIVITHRDRLARFAFDLLAFLFDTCNVELVVQAQLEKELTESKEHNGETSEQLAEDLMAIIHVFSCREYGKRSHAHKRKRSEGEDEQNASQSDHKIVVGGSRKKTGGCSKQETEVRSVTGGTGKSKEGENRETTDTSSTSSEGGNEYEEGSSDY